MVEIEVKIERKLASLPVFVVVPAEAVAAWGLDATTTVEGTLGGAALGRRSLKRWDDDRWFLEVPQPVLAAAGLAVGDRALLRIAPASAELPPELAELLEQDRALAGRWASLTAAQQRSVREEVFAARSSEARARRARKLLAPPPPPEPAPAVVGAGPRTLRVVVVGTGGPGRTCPPHVDLEVSMQVGDALVDPFPGDVAVARWETEVTCVPHPDGLRWKGPAVHGPTRERFLYLAWTEGTPHGRAMFRRAKLKLATIPAELLGGSGVEGRLDLTLPDGTPVCATPRSLRWRPLT